MPAPVLRLVTLRPGGGGRVALVHGFTQTHASWAPVVGEMPPGPEEVVAVDLPGHGESGEVRADLVTAAAAVGEACGRAVYVGYSLGGRVCLRLAVDRPELVRGLVLVGASPGLADPAERAARRAVDEDRARVLERDGVAAFLDGWLAQRLFATLPEAAAGREARLGNTAGGLASSLRLAGAGAQEPLWERLGELGMPVLLVTGGLDRKFTALAGRMAAEIGGNARAVVVPGSGHAVHLERSDVVAGLVAGMTGGRW